MAVEVEVFEFRLNESFGECINMSSSCVFHVQSQGICNFINPRLSILTNMLYF